jgi:predicted nuclease with TOPRIM domain
MSHEIAETDQNELTRLRAELEATRADLDTLRNGVAWLGAELDRVKMSVAALKAEHGTQWPNVVL